MTQDERWQKRYEEVVGFIETNKRNTSKYVADLWESGITELRIRERIIDNDRRITEY